MISDVGIAIYSYGQAAGMMFRKGIRRYLLIPVLLNIIMLVLVIWGAVAFGGAVTDYLLALLPGWGATGWTRVVLRLVFQHLADFSISHHLQIFGLNCDLSIHGLPF